MHGFSPTTFIAGARLHQIDAENGREPKSVWVLPKPPKSERHFKSAGLRVLFKHGILSFEAATRDVPIYRGADMRLVRSLRVGKPPSSAGNVPGRYRRAAKRHHDTLVLAA